VSKKKDLSKPKVKIPEKCADCKNLRTGWSSDPKWEIPTDRICHIDKPDGGCIEALVYDVHRRPIWCPLTKEKEKKENE